MKSIDGLIQPYMEEQAALGAAVALLQDGEIVHLGGYGTTTCEEHGIPVTPRTLFAYGSICKNLCAVLVMRLVEGGLLDLDKPIVHYLPNLRFSRADYGGRITLHHLLSHSSGLPMGGKYWGPRDPDSLRRFMVEQLPYYAFLSEPGAVHLYSNTVFCIAGHMAEVVTGRFYDDLVQTYVFNPLGMDRVTYDPIVAMTHPLALPHEPGPDGELRVKHRMPINASGHPSSFAYGSVSDLAVLARMYLSQGQYDGEPFLSPSSIAEMQSLQASRHIEITTHPLADNYLGYGLGFEVGRYREKRAAGHGGMTLSYNCFFKLFPEERAGVVVLTNHCDDPLLWKMVTALYDHALGLPPPETVFPVVPVPAPMLQKPDDLERYRGDYLRVETAETAGFAISQGQLVLRQQEKETPLVALGEGRFYVQGSNGRRRPVVFVDDAAGRVSHVVIDGEPYHPFELDLKPQPDFHLWSSFEGVYKDPSNDNRAEIFSVRRRGDVLFIAEGDHEVPCRGIGSRCFICALGLFEFEDTEFELAKVLVWGKATRYYPLDRDAYGEGIIRYRVDVPIVPQRVQ